MPLQQANASAPASSAVGTMVAASVKIARTAINLRTMLGHYANAIWLTEAILVPLPQVLARAHLTRMRIYRYRKCMAQSFLVFDFGSDEELAQQARHKVDGWKQGFRLDKKVLLKFKRSEPSEGEAEAEEAQGEEKSGTKSRRKKTAEASAKENVQLIIRLDFSDHERLSHQRWLERIPSEAPFKDAQSKIIRQNDAEFAGTAEQFDSLA